VAARVRDCEEQLRQTERKVWTQYSRLEDVARKSVEQVKKAQEDGKVKQQAAVSDLRSEMLDQRQRLQNLEVQQLAAVFHFRSEMLD
ncbi:hypothetical protein T484DRAFT_1837123, partial [Baffinella frigidus]